ncbi:MAG: DUF4407 domain-containing protein [Bacteroidia bacterium]|nr:DUF4407 domain-containing protein [Bacteroidia bacterium]
MNNKPAYMNGAPLNGTNQPMPDQYKPGKWERFFISITHPDFELLSQCPERDWKKMKVLGIILVMLFVYNTFAATTGLIFYGLGTLPAFVMSLILALMIFWFDVFMVLSSSVNPELNSFKRIWNFIFRIFISFCIGYLLSLPMELYIFSDSIHKEFYKEKMAIADSLRKQEFTMPHLEKAQAEFEKELGEIEKRKNEIAQRMEALKREINSRSSYYTYIDRDGNKRSALSISGKKTKSEMEELEIERAGLAVRVKETERKRDSVMQLKNARSQAFRNAMDTMVNQSMNLLLPERLVYLKKITGGLLGFSKPLYIFDKMLSLLFILFDVLPVLLKALFMKGPYEAMVYYRNEVAKQEERRRLESLMNKHKEEKDALDSEMRMQEENRRSREYLVAMENRHREEMKEMELEHERKLRLCELEYEEARHKMLYQEDFKSTLRMMNDILDRLDDKFTEEVTNKIPYFKERD